MASNPIPSQVRQKVHERAEHRCERCGTWDKHKVQAAGYKTSGKSFACHHIDGAESVVENLALLCVVCHREWHFLERVGIADKSQFWDWIKSKPFEWLERGV